MEMLLELTFPEALVACSVLLGCLRSPEVCDEQASHCCHTAIPNTLGF
jgi:hypothetical protein